MILATNVTFIRSHNLKRTVSQQ